MILGVVGTVRIVRGRLKAVGGDGRSWAACPECASRTIIPFIELPGTDRVSCKGGTYMVQVAALGRQRSERGEAFDVEPVRMQHPSDLAPLLP